MLEIPKSKIFLILCLAFILGVGVWSALYLYDWLIDFFWLYLAFLSALAGIILPKNRTGRIVFAVICFFILGAARFDFSLETINENHIAFWNGKEAIIRGVVSEEPDVRLENQKLALKILELQIAEGRETKKEMAGKLLLTVPLYPKYSYGDEVEFKCRLRPPGKFSGFDYARYLWRYDIYSLCYYPKEVKVLGQNRGNFLFENLLKLKNYFNERTAKILPEPEASFLGGILYGLRHGIPENLMEAFNRTGTTHLIAISGYNVTIVIAVLAFIFVNIFGRRRAFPLIILGILFFVLISGGSSSVIRAGIMAGILVFGRQIGRSSNIYNALILAAVLMLIINPKVLLFDAGFQLSFAATCGLIWCSPILGRLFRDPILKSDRAGFLFLTIFQYFKQIAIDTLSAIAFTLPLILFYFGRLSLVAVFANLLILPLIPWTMLFGFLAVFGACFWLPLGNYLAFFAWPFLRYVIFAATSLAKLSFASVDLGRTNILVIILFYFILIFGLWMAKRRLEIQDNDETEKNFSKIILRPSLKRKIALGFAFAFLAFIISAAVVLNYKTRAPNKLEVIFLDVGQGEAALINTPAGNQILIDGGPDFSVLGELGKFMPFYDRKIETVILTHPHADHFTGLMGVLERFEAGRILTINVNCPTDECQTWQDFIKNQKTAVEHLQAGDVFQTDGISFRALWPYDVKNTEGKPEEKGKLNDISLVLRIDYGKNSFLFTGDISSDIEKQLPKEFLDVDVLKVAHHGSKYATSQEFLEKTTPQIAIIEVGEKNKFRFPSLRVLKRLEKSQIKIFRTDTDGDIKIQSDGTNLSFF